ncbi:xylulokinase [Calorimonas adulescens]|uniref:Xylulokinase n=1 Tax=Calorimonas adulescens TaxID=2606906 RepID=A0A5D8QCI1_9THEO|nr:FGGY family carbohydrate kinase [Calorimonas adulescens]TZE81506.1 xylulokinase [Calorimonas adulescens]
MNVIITYDIGTTSLKTVFFDTDGNILYSSSREYRIYSDGPGYAEQDPDDWWGAIIGTTRDGLAAIGDADIIGIGLSSQRETVTAVDNAGRPMMRAISWMDRRSKDEANILSKRFGFDYLHDHTGLISDTTFTATKLLWFKNNGFDLCSAFKFLQPKDYIIYKLTGEYVEDYSLACRTMYLDIKDKKWMKDVLDFIGINPEKLPSLVYSDEVAGRLTREAAAVLGLRDGIPVVAGAGDRQCEALGVGIDRDTAMESTGTTTNLSVSLDSVPKNIDKRVTVSIHSLRDKYLMEQGMTTSGTIYRWFRDEFCKSERETAEQFDLDVYDLIDEKIEKKPVGSGGLILLPFFMGAKATRWNPNARGTILGFTLGTDRWDIARAILEGVAYEINACIGVLEENGIEISEMIGMGGGSKGRVWSQIKADVTGKRVKKTRTQEAASLGAYLLTLKGLGIINDPVTKAREINSAVEYITPDEAAHEKYKKYYNVYEELYSLVEPIFNKLTKM